MSVLLLYSGETSFFVAMIRAIIVRVLPYGWYKKPKIVDRIKVRSYQAHTITAQSAPPEHRRSLLRCLCYN